MTTASKIKSFACLPHGWRFDEGGPIAAREIASALKWVEFLAECGVTEADASPGESGSILLAAFISGKYTQIVFEPTGDFTVSRYLRPERALYRSNLSETEARHLVHQILEDAK